MEQTCSEQPNGSDGLDPPTQRACDPAECAAQLGVQPVARNRVCWARPMRSSLSMAYNGLSHSPGGGNHDAALSARDQTDQKRASQDPMTGVDSDRLLACPGMYSSIFYGIWCVGSRSSSQGLLQVFYFVWEPFLMLFGTLVGIFFI